MKKLSGNRPARCGWCRRIRKRRKLVRTWVGPAFTHYEWRCAEVVRCWRLKTDREMARTNRPQYLRLVSLPTGVRP